MKPSPLLLLFICLLFFSNCKKKDNRNYSYWQVNQDKFSTNDITVDEGKARHDMYAKNFTNNYSIRFNLGYFPVSDSFKIDCSLAAFSWVCFTITYNGIGYINPKKSYLKALSVNGNPQYQLSPTWFYNENKFSDSVLVQGVFNQP
jgi:hypothetical protein